MLQKYAFDTELDTSMRHAKAICPDGISRVVKLTNGGYADTFFSIPGRVQCKGKTVTGFITCETMEGFSTGTEDDPVIVRFVPVKYGANYSVFYPGVEYIERIAA